MNSLRFRFSCKFNNHFKNDLSRALTVFEISFVRFQCFSLQNGFVEQNTSAIVKNIPFCYLMGVKILLVYIL